jgi:hypothetical protein
LYENLSLTSSVTVSPSISTSISRQAVVGIEIGLTMRADEERSFDGTAAALGFAEHDVGTDRQTLLDFRRVRELLVVEGAVEVVTKQEFGIARLVLEHVRRMQLRRHEARRARDGSHERLRRIGKIDIRLGRRAVNVVVLAQAGRGCDLERADARRRLGGTVEAPRRARGHRHRGGAAVGRRGSEPAQVAIVGAFRGRAKRFARRRGIPAGTKRQAAVVARQRGERRVPGSASELLGRLGEVAELVVDDAEVVVQERRVEACRPRFAVAQQRRAVNARPDQLVTLVDELGGRLGRGLAAFEAGRKQQQHQRLGIAHARLPRAGLAPL